VNGKYRVEAGMVGNSNVGMLEVVNHLIVKERELISAGAESGAE
jgi:hypothetical protein